MKMRPKILVAPLDWGLGHITRCIPIVNELVMQGWEVWLAGNERGLALMKKEFSNLSTVYFEGYNVFYHPSKNRFSLTILKQLPRIARNIKAENRWLKSLLHSQKFDAIISDNRFGVYHPNVHSIFITHQLHIKSGVSKWIDRMIQRINFKYINRFNQCWVPDYAGTENLAGELAHGNPLPSNIRYIGPVSRFEKMQVAKKYELLILLSGPEPNRTNFEKKILSEIERFKGRVLFVRGLPEVEGQIEQPANCDIINHLSASNLNIAIEQSEWIICRSGYTSVMDLVKLEHKAILIPTPGQPEQEYLAKYLYQKGVFYTVGEDEFCLEKNIAEAKMFPYSFNTFSAIETHFKTAITELTQTILSRKKTVD